MSPTGSPWFASSSRELASRQTVDETLQFAVDLASELIVGCEFAGVMFWQREDTTTPASTDSRAIVLDEAQAEAGEGPCVLAATTEQIVVANDLADDERFPVFGPRAAAFGTRAAVACKLFLDGTRGARLGALNLYGARPDAFTAEAIETGAVFATHCATVLVAAIAREGFDDALASRDPIGQAKGILMERSQLTASRAFDLLRQSSQDLDVKLRDVAEHVGEHRRSAVLVAYADDDASANRRRRDPSSGCCRAPRSGRETRNRSAEPPGREEIPTARESRYPQQVRCSRRGCLA